MSNKNKRIRHHHVTALRDLGGIFGDIKIKKGLVYRSSFLGNLSDDEANSFVQKFNIGRVIDLRSDEEILVSKDLQINNVDYFHFPILANEDNPAVTKQTRNKILQDIAKNRGGALNHLEEKYRMMVSNKRSLAYFRRVFDVLLSPSDNAIIYHCTQRKDRTGVCTALILLALGVDRKSIARDYVNFNSPYRIKNSTISVLAFFRFFSLKVSKSLFYLQMAHPSLINAVFDKFGSEEKFLSEGLNLTLDELLKLKERYLEQ